MNQPCECANLEWTPEQYHHEHHPKCTAFIKKLETDIIQTLQDAAETLDKLRDVEPVSYEDARELVQAVYDQYSQVEIPSGAKVECIEGRDEGFTIISVTDPNGKPMFIPEDIELKFVDGEVKTLKRPSPKIGRTSARAEPEAR